MNRLASLLLVLFLVPPSAAATLAVATLAVATLAVVTLAVATLAVATPAAATPQPLRFSQSRTETALQRRLVRRPWHRRLPGDNLTAAIGGDPQTILAADDPGVLDANANQTAPDSFTTGGVAEFELANPTIALNGSGTADAPFILLHLNTAGFQSIQVSYTLRDLDGSGAPLTVSQNYFLGRYGPPRAACTHP